MNERLRASMTRRATTVEGLAAQVQVDPKTVQRWLAGRVPHARHRWAIASFLHEDETYLWPHQASSHQPTTRAELVTLYPHRADVPFDLWWYLFNRAERQIEILVYAALFLHEQYPTLNRLLASKCSAGCSVRVALGDPDSQAIRERGSEEAFGEGIESRCRVARTHYEALLGLPNFELRLHGTTLYNSIYRFDSDMLVNTHVWAANAYSAPVLHLRELPRGSLFNTYAESFETVWQSGEPIDQPLEAAPA